jgi:hypothetical protein
MPPAIAAVGVVAAKAIGLTGIAAAIFGGVVSTVVSIGVSKLIAPRGPKGGSQPEDTAQGARIQLPPATNNRLPVVYGSAFIGGSITDAKISTDLQTMWYVVSLAEVTNTMPGDTPDVLAFDQIYYDGKLVSLSGAQVTSLTTNTAGGGEVDTKINGNLFMYLFPNGSFSGTNTGGQSAIQIMSDTDIPSNQRWNQGIYTAGGQSASMTNTAFMIVKVKYNNDAGTTGLGAVNVKLTNSRTKPGDCIKDYLLNDRYGCAVPLSQIDTASLTALNTYSDKPIVYTPAGGGPTTTQVRYRFNGPIATNNNCLDNLQTMVDACDSWMQYSELTGQWKVVINKAYNETPDPIAFNNLYHVTDNNLTDGINVSPTNLNQTFNEVEYQYPNNNIRDQLDFIFISLQEDYPSLLNANEPVNKLTLKNDLVNNYVQAKFIAIRRILQGREDLVVSFQTDYSGIQVEAGDVIRITNNAYGWTNKLFRVSNVVEEKDAEGNLFARLTAFEYNGTIYDDDLDITDFIPELNTGLQDPNIIGTPDAPIVTLDTANTLNSLSVTGTVPSIGLVRYLEFNYGNSNVSEDHAYYSRVTNSNGSPLLANASYTINVNNIIDAGNIYWSVTARNDQVGVRSGASNVVVWPGANVSVANTVNICNASSTASLITTDPIAGNILGGRITITSGNGTLQANTFVTSIVDSTQFFVNLVPTVPLSNACIDVEVGGIGGNNIQANTITLTNLDRNLNTLQGFGGTNFSIANYTGNSITMPINAAANTTRNVPIYITGTTVSSTNYYPWYQGTSTNLTGSNGNNYYGSNSTSSFNPIGASVIQIADGDDNWYTAIFDDFPANTIPSNETYFMNYGLTMVSDTANTLVQVAIGLERNNAGFYQVLTDALHTITLQANLPEIYAASYNASGSSVANITSSAVFVRNMTGGANLIIVKGSLASSRGQTPYY